MMRFTVAGAYPMRSATVWCEMAMPRPVRWSAAAAHSRQARSTVETPATRRRRLKASEAGIAMTSSTAASQSAGGATVTRA